MSNNLVIGYDLYKWSQTYFKVEAAIKGLGPAIKVYPTLWYVKTPSSVSEAKETIMAAMDQNDALFVVDAANNTTTSHNVRDEVEKFVQTNWPVSLDMQVLPAKGHKAGSAKRVGR